MNNNRPTHPTQITKASDNFATYANGKAAVRSVAWWRYLWALPAYHWVLMACGVVFLLHITSLPFWLSLFGGLTLVAQIPSIKVKVINARFKMMTYRQVYRAVQLVGFLGSALGLWVFFGQSFGADISIAFLVLCLIAKLWELNTKRDGYVALTLGLFVAAAAFLWSQSLILAVMVLFAVAMALFGFIALADENNNTGSGRGTMLGLIMLPAVPMLVVLFLFFPRFDPLWSLQLASNKSTTGVSDSMSPGDFANLSKSTELAFRVEFDQIPSRDKLYWRGLVFHHFDGVTWTQDNNRPDIWRYGQPMPTWATPLAGEPFGTYQVMMEPTQQNWLFALDYSYSHTPRTFLTDDFALRSFAPITSQFHYQASYQPNSVVKSLSASERTSSLQLPSTGNEQSRRFAKQMYNEAGGDPIAFARQIERYISGNDFFYTLNPPTLGGERIDDFLFGTRRGFCEHYASSFVFLMRAAGVPARVVVGYQGGQLGRDGNSWEVRQMDAHAWAEVWVDNVGWQRIDPTAFVAPSRIEEGMSEYTEGQGASVFGDGVAGAMGYQQFKLLQSLRRLSDEASYYWQKDVVGYDSEAQKSSLFNRFNITSLGQQLLIMATAFLAALSLFVAVIWYRRRVRHHPFDEPVERLSKALRGISPALARKSYESHFGYLSRLAKHTGDKQLLELAGQYRHYRYGSASMNSNQANYHRAARKFSQDLKALDKKTLANTQNFAKIDA